MKRSHNSSKSLFSTPQSKFSAKKLEPADKLSELSSTKPESTDQRNSIKSLMSSPRLSNLTKDEFKFHLILETEEKEETFKTLQSERDRLKGLEKDLETCKTAVKELEAKNRLFKAENTEKDRIISRCICEMLIVKQEVEKLTNPSSQLCKNLASSLTLLYASEVKSEAPKAKTDQENWVLTYSKSQKYYENEISRLQKQLTETQNLYKTTNCQLKEIIEKTTKQDSGFLKNKPDSIKPEFLNFSSLLLRNVSEKDLTKNLLAEIGELKKKKQEQDLEVSRLEARYKTNLNELKEDLSRSREKILELIQTKTAQEQEISSLKFEKKEITQDLNFKNLKISDLTAQIASLNQEIKQLKTLKKCKSSDFIDSKARQNYEQKIQDLTQKTESLTGKIQQLETSQKTPDQSQAKTIVQQLSNIILSRDKQNNPGNKDLKRTLSKLLIENHDIFEAILFDYFGKNYENLREVMQEKSEKLSLINEDLQKENKLISEQLKLESQKRSEIFCRLRELENEVRENKRLGSERSSVRDFRSFNCEESESSEVSKNDLICMIKCAAETVEYYING